MLLARNDQIISARAVWPLTFLIIPIFFDSGGLFNSIETDARGFPVSLVFILALPIILFKTHRRRVIIVFAVSTLSIIFIWLIAGIFNSEFVSYTLIGSYLAPILVGYCASVLLSTSDDVAVGNYHWFVWGAILSAISIAWISFQISNIFLMGRANGSVWEIFVIYQVWVYWPTVLAIVFCLQTEKSGYVTLMIRIILFSAILVTGAREPILFCIIYFAVYFLMVRNLRSFLVLAIFVFAMLGAGVAILTFLPESIIYLKVASQFSGEQDLSAGRFGVLGQFNFAEVSPLIGTGFTLDAIFGSPHNQYLELYYRGGLVPIIAIVSCFIFACLSGWQDKVLVSLVITLMIVSFNINTPLRSPYAGAIIWFIIFRMIPRLTRQSNYETNPPEPLHG